MKFPIIKSKAYAIQQTSFLSSLHPESACKSWDNVIPLHSVTHRPPMFSQEASNQMKYIYINIGILNET